MNGKSYYAHIVLERQTIFGITKAYDVTEEVLYSANPRLKEEGLKSGTVIYIPIVERSAAQAARKPAPWRRSPQDQSFVEHTVM